MQTKCIFLSHTLSERTPGYGGKKEFALKKTKSLVDGNSCNQSQWQLSNHIGTHIDAPLHFSQNGKSLDQYPAEFWIFNKPELCHVPTQSSQLIDVSSWCEKIPVNADLLLIKTDFEKFRTSDVYWSHNPGLTPQLGTWLREHRPRLRAVGFDFISLTSYAHRAIGKEAHHAFLHEDHSGSPVLIIEDMRLSELIENPVRVIVAPLIVEKSDGSPVTVIAEF